MVGKWMQNFVISVCWSSCGRWLITGSKDYTFKIWDSQTGLQQMSIKAHREYGHRRGRRFVTGGADQLLRVWRHIPRVAVGDAEEDLCGRLEKVNVSSSTE
ncbi:hypothetical protein L249_5111 [Ophiocordyceps polyrhachis-furcata BCC 54312]|uniref:Uncharacterized protein n=1 Tax=Ophiocordyceps polyrhachis-furcata BCC 54312 TaxID=1330021 RepID=A0A367L3C9_9HYPO|nr:hypothetical protein L249_5111 [Ophiocordyceps polyrhachis-furcata BCC 54312]